MKLVVLDFVFLWLVSYETQGMSGINFAHITKEGCDVGCGYPTELCIADWNSLSFIVVAELWYHIAVNGSFVVVTGYRH
jgi:hypothetical protein